MVRFAVDGDLSFSHFPLQVATFLGFAATAIAFLGLPLVVVARYTGIYERGVPSLMFVVLLLGGLQLMVLGRDRRVRRAHLRRGQAPAALRRARGGERRASPRAPRRAAGALGAVRVAVIGAGVCGLVAGPPARARPVTACDVYERWNGLGGQAATLDVGGGLRLERYYHHLFTSDRHIAALYDELGMPDELEWRRSSMAFFVRGRQWAFTTPLDLLRFGPLSPVVAAAHGPRRAAAAARRRATSGRTRASPRATWITRAMGREAYDDGLGPAAARQVRRPRRRHLDGLAVEQAHAAPPARGRRGARGAARLPARLVGAAVRGAAARRIEAHGGRVLIDRPATRLARRGRRPRADGRGAPARSAAATTRARFDPAGEPERYDAVLATVPNDVFAALLDPALAAEVGDGYLGRLAGDRVPRRALPAARARPPLLAASTGPTWPTGGCRSSA